MGGKIYTCQNIRHAPDPTGTKLAGGDRSIRSDVATKPMDNHITALPLHVSVA